MKIRSLLFIPVLILGVLALSSCKEALIASESGLTASPTAGTKEAIVTSAPTDAGNDIQNDQKPVSEFSDEEIRAFMIQYAVMPRLGAEESFQEDRVFAIVKSLLKQVQKESPLSVFPSYGDSRNNLIAISVHRACAAYYGWEANDRVYAVGQSFVRQDSLQQNSVLEAHKELMGVSNGTYLFGGSKVSMVVSDFADGQPEKSIQEYVEEIRERGIKGCEILSVSTDRPSYNDLADDEFAVAYRKGSDGALLTEVHQLLLTEKGWVHKPDYSDTVLLLNHLPDPSVDWISEMSYEGQYAYLGTVVYSGPIYYIVFKKAAEQ